MWNIRDIFMIGVMAFVFIWAMNFLLRAAGLGALQA